jgi:hypothetical protein
MPLVIYSDAEWRLSAPSRRSSAAHLPRTQVLGAAGSIHDKDDVFGYPLKTLNDKYGDMVTKDRETNIGRFMTSWTPISHLDYWTDKDVTEPIAKSLVKMWKAVNP